MGKYERDPHRANSRRRKRKWHYYIPTVILLCVALVCIITIGWTIASVLRSNDPSPEDGTAPNKITINTAPTTEPTEPATEPGPTTDELIVQADFVAAGYDYDTAIEMLKASPDFSTDNQLGSKVEQYTNARSKLIKYTATDTVTHIFFHSLIVDTERAFDGDVDQDGYNMYMTTVDEFRAILQQMYDRGFVLISPYHLAHEVTDDNGTRFTYGDILLPAGKTPFIMSQDDLNYYSYMIGTGSGKNETPIFVDKNNDGFAHKIVIGEDGYPTCEYMDADGNITTGDYDLVPILERFIQDHPDFSYHGARAILGMTGYEGVFGYRTKPSYEAAMGSEAYAAEVQAAKDVAQCLRDHGWILASHSYGHPAYGNISAERVATDSEKWTNTVASIIGKTDVILFPHGSDIHNWRKYTTENEKFVTLYEDGYRYFFNVDGNQYWNQLGETYFRGGRRNIDGIRMYHHPEKLTDLFDTETVFDKTRPIPVPSTGSGM